MRIKHRMWLCIFLGLSQVVSAQASLSDIARAAFYKGHFQEALAEANIIESDVEPDILVLKSQIYLKKKQPDLALQELLKYTPSEFESSYVTDAKLQCAIAAKNDAQINAASDELLKSQNRFFIRKTRIALARYRITKNTFIDAFNIIKPELTNTVEPILYPEVLKAAIHCKLAMNEFDEALKFYGQLLSLAPNGDENKKIWQQLQLYSPSKIAYSDGFISEEQQYQYLKQTYNSQSDAAFIDASEKFSDQYPGTIHGAEVYLLTAHAYFRLYQFGRAIPLFSSVLNNNPTPAQTAEALYYLGVSYQGAKSPDSAITTFENLIQIQSSSVYHAKALYHICKYYQKNGPRKQLQAYESVFDKYRLEPEYQTYLWESKLSVVQNKVHKRRDLRATAALTTLYTDAELAPVLDIYEALAKRSVKRRSKSLLFYEAVRQYPISYHVLTILNSQSKSKKAFSKISSHRLVQQYDHLYQLGLAEIALTHCAYQQQMDMVLSDTYLYCRLLLLTRLERYQDAMVLLSDYEDKLKDSPSFILPFLYPKPYWAQIEESARKNDTDPYLVLAVMRETSRFDPQYRGSNGTLGLMSLSPQDGHDIAFRLGRLWKNETALYDPETSIEFGTFYLGWLAQTLGDNPHYVLAGYHAGPNMAHQWITQFGTTDFNAFVEQVPYAQTKAFIKNVMDTYLIYKKEAGSNL